MSNAERNPLAEYLREISRYPVLTKQEEIELSKRIEKGDEEARKKLINSNLRFAVYTAKKYRTSSSPTLLDLIGYGNIGLVESAKRYDYHKGFRFTSYAVWWIRQSILYASNLNPGTLTTSMKLNNHLCRTKRYLDTLRTEGFSINEAIKKFTDGTNENPEILKGLLQNYENPLSLDSPKFFEDGEIFRKEGIASGYPDLIEEVFQKDLKSETDNFLKERLSEREYEIIKYRFGLKNGRKYTFVEIGKIYGLTKERIRQIQEVALKKLRAGNAKRLASYLEYQNEPA